MGTILTESAAEGLKIACEQLYNSIGVSAVCDYANKIGLEYGFCAACENEQPVIQTEHSKECAVCGTGISTKIKIIALIPNRFIGDLTDNEWLQIAFAHGIVFSEAEFYRLNINTNGYYMQPLFVNDKFEIV